MAKFDVFDAFGRNIGNVAQTGRFFAHGSQPIKMEVFNQVGKPIGSIEGNWYISASTEAGFGALGFLGYLVLGAIVLVGAAIVLAWYLSWLALFTMPLWATVWIVYRGITNIDYRFLWLWATTSLCAIAILLATLPVQASATLFIVAALVVLCYIIKAVREEPLF